MISEQAAYLAYAGGWQVVRRMPARVAYSTFDRIADQQWRAQGKGVRQLQRNLSRVIGEPEDSAALMELSREGMRSYMRYWCDAFRLPGWSREQVLSYRFHNEDLIKEILATGRGVIVAVPHMGNWDHIGAYACLELAPVTTVIERLKPEKLYQAFVHLRESRGITIHGLGDPGVYASLVQAASTGGLVALIGDRDLSAKGIEVDFFGSPARFPAGPAALAVDTGAALMATSVFREGAVNAGRVLREIVPPQDGSRSERIVATTALLARAFEEAIAAHPQDWHMLQKVWLADLDPARMAARDRGEES